MPADLRRTTVAAAGLDPAGLAAAFNATFADYVVPFAVDAAWVDRHVRANGLRLEHSPLWLDAQGAPAALAVLGARGDVGWVGGLAVAPPHRGRGLGRDLIAATLAEARALGLRRVELEVLVQNAPAVRAYARAGFLPRRDLRVLVRPADAPAPAADPAAVRDAAPADLLPLRDTLAAPAPAWQRAPAALAALPDLAGLALGDRTRGPDPTAYLLYAATPKAVAVWDLAGDPAALPALLRALLDRASGRPLHLLNEPEDSPFAPALAATAWQEAQRQHELVRDLR